MRIHSQKLTREDFRRVLQAEQAAGRIAPHVRFKTLDERGSHSHGFAFEVQLEAGQRDHGRRAGNSGSYGAMQPEYDGYAATYDEWGWLLAGLFELAPYAVVGTARNPIYDGRGDFHNRTGESYNPASLIESILRNEERDPATPGDPYPYVIGQTGGREGRRGAGRVSVDAAYQWGSRAAQAAYAKWQANNGARVGNDQVKFLPRSVADVRAFARLDAPTAV